ncbi:MAG: response regulator [Alphaproteobacteria bacterium]|nr:response regulator [Alphaproteobacteria bacterium]
MKRYILLIEDENFQAELFARIIEAEVKERDYKVITLGSGRDALKFFAGEEVLKIKTEEVGLVLLDLAIHDVSGLQVLAKIHPKIPVAVLSANEDEDVKKEALRLGAQDYFVKGKNLEELNRLRRFILHKMG